MACLNRVELIGNVGKDPELKFTQSGKAVLKFSVATNEKYKNKAGEQQELTEWHNCTAWDRLAETMSKYLVKGKQVYIEGKLKTDSYEKDGVKRFVTSIVVQSIQLLGSKGSATPRQAEDSSSIPANDQYQIDDDQLPF